MNVEDEDPKSNPLKKRGRKPKGGKLILDTSNNNANLINDNKSLQSLSSCSSSSTETDQIVINKPNVILHLKCSMRDIENDMSSDWGIGDSDIRNSHSIILSSLIPSTESVNTKTTTTSSHFASCIAATTAPGNENAELIRKLKTLENKLHFNKAENAQSACFWCTYEFETPAIFIPKHWFKDGYNVYGCFCSPECATAYLMNEPIDSSTKFERYYLLNQMYSCIFNYNKGIKPAPNPHYLLSKFQGILSIEDYRKISKLSSLYLVLNKPLTRVFPEIHEDNDEFILSNKIIPSNNSFQLNKSNTTKNPFMQH